ncbi:hypothetical protein AABB24_039795, partial [Solanum stoloniferum]
LIYSFLSFSFPLKNRSAAPLCWPFFGENHLRQQCLSTSLLSFPAKLLLLLLFSIPLFSSLAGKDEQNGSKHQPAINSEQQQNRAAMGDTTAAAPADRREEQQQFQPAVAKRGQQSTTATTKPPAASTPASLAPFSLVFSVILLRDWQQ